VDAKKRCKVFVSYSRHDEALVRPLAGLQGVAADGAVFLDVTSLKPGDPWEEELFDALKEAEVFVVCWCCESEKSKNVAKEIAAALAEGNKRVVPVLLCAATLPPQLAMRQWIDLRGRVVHECSFLHLAALGPKVRRILLTLKYISFAGLTSALLATATIRHFWPTSGAGGVDQTSPPVLKDFEGATADLLFPEFPRKGIEGYWSPSGEIPPVAWQGKHDRFDLEDYSHRLYVNRWNRMLDLIGTDVPYSSAFGAVALPTNSGFEAGKPDYGSKSRPAALANTFENMIYSALVVSYLIVGGVVALIALLLREFWPSSGKDDRARADDIAAKVKAYFEGLAPKKSTSS
jgi:hypothetical protein